MPDTEKIVKQSKISQKGASGSGKPKQPYVSLQERLVTEHSHIENIEPNTISEEILSEIHKAPCSISPPLDLSPKKAFLLVHHIHLSLTVISKLPTFQIANTLPTTPVMAGPQAATKMERIIAVRYGPLVLPIPLNAIPIGEYLDTFLVVIIYLATLLEAEPLGNSTLQFWLNL